MSGFLDKAKKKAREALGRTTLDEKAKDLAGKHSDKIDRGLGKAADFANRKTGGKYSRQIDQGANRVRDALADEQDPGTGQHPGSDKS